MGGARKADPSLRPAAAGRNGQEKARDCGRDENDFGLAQNREAVGVADCARHQALWQWGANDYAEA
jgi:hypothetical protein